MEDFDLAQFVSLFDTAMTSDNPTVKKAFKNLMLVAALVESENEVTAGPLRNLMKSVDDLRNEVSMIKMNQQYQNNMNTVYGPITTNTPYQIPTNTPTWTAPTYTYTTGTGGAIGVAGGNTTASVNTFYTKLDELFTDVDSK